MTVLLVAGSTALILFAIRFLRKGLDRLLATRLGGWLDVLASTPGRGLLLGMGVAALAPSSSGMAAAVARIARGGRIAPATAFAMLLGANIGLTSLVVLGAAGADGWYPPLLIAGVVLFQFTRHDVSRGLGQGLIAFGLILLGMHLARQALLAVHDPEAEALIAIALRHPLVLAASTMALTVAMQSSSLTILLVMCLVEGRPVPIDGVTAIVAGANLGLAATALAVGWGDRGSRLPALALAVVKGAASLAALAVAGCCAGGLDAADGARSAASIHVLVALATAAAGMAASGWLLRRLAASPLAGPAPDAGAQPRFLAIAVDGDQRLALANARREILHVAERVRGMFDQAWRAWRAGDARLAREAARLDDQIDGLDLRIRSYLAGIGGDGTAADGDRILQLRYTVQLEAIGDLIEKQVAPMIARTIPLGGRIAPACRQRLDAASQAAHRALLTAETVFATGDRDLARRLQAMAAEMAAMYAGERDRALWRLRGGASDEADAMYLELVGGLERIVACAAAVAGDALAAVHDADPPPEMDHAPAAAVP